MRKFKLTSLHEKDLIDIELFIYSIQLNKIYRKKPNGVYMKIDEAQSKRIKKMLKHGFIKEVQGSRGRILTKV